MTPVYLGVFLSPQEFHKLTEWWGHEIGHPLTGVVPKYPHVTVHYGPSWGEIQDAPLGRVVKLTVVGWAADDKGQAVVVTGIRALGKPHVTLSFDPGLGPVYSNDLIAKGFVKTHGPTLVGRFGVYDKDTLGPLYELPTDAYAV